jgi:hypothetical protein
MRKGMVTTGARELTLPMRIKIIAIRPTNIEAAYGSWFAPRYFEDNTKMSLKKLCKVC